MSPPDANATAKKIRRMALFFTTFLVAGFLVVHLFKSGHENALAKETADFAALPELVDVITVGAEPATASLTLPGETAAWYESTIYARVDGYVGNWSANIGDHVKKGQVLATIETPELDAQLTASKAKLAAAQAAAGLAKTTYERWHDSPKGVVSEQEREEKKAAFATAEAQVKLDQADVSRYQTMAQFKEVAAPFDGIITERHIDIGNLVTAGSNASTTPLYHITQNNPMRVFIDVPQSAASDMKNGVSATISASNLPGHSFSGAIARTADAMSASSRTLRVEVDLPNKDQELVPGMYVNVGFDLPAQDWLQLPAAALIFRNAGPQVAVVAKDKHVHFRPVTIARDNGSTVEIGSGIATGDQVALNISNQVDEGAAVQVNQSGENDAHAPAAKE